CHVARSDVSQPAPGDAPGRNRTCDLALRRRALYPLSYGRSGTQCTRAPAIGSRAVEVDARIARLRLAETFVISRESTDEVEVVHVALSHEGVTGHGEAAPAERYGESAASALGFVEEH